MCVCVYGYLHRYEYLHEDNFSEISCQINFLRINLFHLRLIFVCLHECVFEGERENKRERERERERKWRSERMRVRLRLRVSVSVGA